MTEATRTLTGLPTRKPPADPKRMLQRNREEVPAVVEAPDVAVAPQEIVEAPERPAVREEAQEAKQAAAKPKTAQPSRSQKPVSKPRASAAAELPGERINASVSAEAKARSVAAYQATAYFEGDASYSDFVERALLAEVTRREAEYNSGEQFSPGKPLRPGRPLKS